VHAHQRAFPFFRFQGTHREIGRQFGEACAELIHRHRDLAQARLQARHGITPERAVAKAARFRDAVLREAPFFDEEIQGIAEGAGLSLSEAYLLQLRAELAVVPDTGQPAEPADECTTFVALAGTTADGVPMIGQNADLPPFYREIGVVVELVPDDAPAVLMLTPAGQVSYIGINDRGMGVFANYITCDGWRVGFPRYLLSRLALTYESVDDAIARLSRVHRASSRNLIMLDRHGNAADLETTPTRMGRLAPDDGLLVHANHFVAPELLDAERSTGSHLENSRARHAQMQRLLDARRGQLSVAVMQDIMRNREGAPNALCRWPEDDAERDVMTFASVIAQPTQGQMWVAVGPPDQHPYHHYAFTQP
jgi:isopenicillin-N N-acyltransferase-like protein